ncbi:hypothetical protein Tco_1570990 [Tanacetum coccineum]
MSNTNKNLQTQTSNALHNAIMEAGGKDRPPMLAPGNYVQWKSRFMRYIDTKPNNELIQYCLQNLPYKFKWAKRIIPVAEGSSETTTEVYMENYKNVSEDIRNQLDAEAEVVQIILTGLDNDIYSTIDALSKCIAGLASHLSSASLEDTWGAPSKSPIKRLISLPTSLHELRHTANHLCGESTLLGVVVAAEVPAQVLDQPEHPHRLQEHPHRL